MDGSNHELRPYNRTDSAIQIEKIIDSERQSKNDEDFENLSRLEDSRALARLGKKQVLKVRALFVGATWVYLTFNSETLASSPW